MVKLQRLSSMLTTPAVASRDTETTVGSVVEIVSEEIVTFKCHYEPIGNTEKLALGRELSVNMYRLYSIPNDVRNGDTVAFNGITGTATGDPQIFSGEVQHTIVEEYSG